MKKEWLLLIVVSIIIYIDSIIHVSPNEIHISEMLLVDFIILLYHIPFFLFVSYYLIPKFFYPKKYFYFFLSLFASIILFAVVEEGVVERIIAHEARGRDAVTWLSIYYFIGETIVPLLVFMSVKFVFDNIEKEKRIEQIEKNQLTNELKFLKSQILGLSNVLRYVLYETVEEKVILTKELDFLKDYIELQKMQLESRGEINFQIKEKANSDQLKISPFLLIPFIENSFKHSLQTKEKGIVINMDIEIKEQQLMLMIENNFEKQSSSGNLLTKGIGLENVKKRLELIYPKYHQINIEDKENWYKVDLKIKLD